MLNLKNKTKQTIKKKHLNKHSFELNSCLLAKYPSTSTPIEPILPHDNYYLKN